MNNYDDIINLEPPVSKKHKKMDAASRAAQFAAFSALTGLDDQVCETARHTDIRRELTDDEKNELDTKIQYIQSIIQTRPLIEVVYFVPDGKKNGGSYNSFSGKIRRIEETERLLIFEGFSVSIDNVVHIEVPEKIL